MFSAIAARKTARASHAGPIKASIQATEEESRESSSEPEQVVPLSKKRVKRKTPKVRSGRGGRKRGTLWKNRCPRKMFLSLNQIHLPVMRTVRNWVLMRLFNVGGVLVYRCGTL